MPRSRLRQPLPFRALPSPPQRLGSTTARPRDPKPRARTLRASPVTGPVRPRWPKVILRWRSARSEFGSLSPPPVSAEKGASEKWFLIARSGLLGDATWWLAAARLSPGCVGAHTTRAGRRGRPEGTRAHAARETGRWSTRSRSSATSDATRTVPDAERIRRRTTLDRDEEVWMKDGERQRRTDWHCVVVGTARRANDTASQGNARCPSRGLRRDARARSIPTRWRGWSVGARRGQGRVCPPARPLRQVAPRTPPVPSLEPRLVRDAVLIKPLLQIR